MKVLSIRQEKLLVCQIKFDRLLYFVGVFYEETHWGGQRIAAISMRCCYYGASSVYECFREVYMGNPR